MADHYTEKVINALAAAIEWGAAEAGKKCQSPIELGLLKALIGVHMCDRRLRIDALPTAGGLLTDWEARLFVQHPVEKYRVDFAIHVTSEAGGKRLSEWIAVECDGHEFHERTREQAARDKARDRAIVAAGFRILRFTGSEIYADPAKCARDVMRLAVSIAEDWVVQ